MHGATLRSHSVCFELLFLLLALVLFSARPSRLCSSSVTLADLVLFYILRVTTCLEMSGNLTAVRKMSGILLKIKEMSGKNLVRWSICNTYIQADSLLSLSIFSSLVAYFCSWPVYLLPCLSKRHPVCFFAICDEQRHCHWIINIIGRKWTKNLS